MMKSNNTSSGSCSSSSQSDKNSVRWADTTIISDRYKTELCRSFMETGVCTYNRRCTFAHGQEELRAKARHPRYKTRFCRAYHVEGFCTYGGRCDFIHDTVEYDRAVQLASLVERMNMLIQRFEGGIGGGTGARINPAAATNGNGRRRDELGRNFRSRSESMDSAKSLYPASR